VDAIDASFREVSAPSASYLAKGLQLRHPPDAVLEVFAPPPQPPPQQPQPSMGAGSPAGVSGAAVPLGADGGGDGASAHKRARVAPAVTASEQVPAGGAGPTSTAAPSARAPFASAEAAAPQEPAAARTATATDHVAAAAASMEKAERRKRRKEEEVAAAAAASKAATTQAATAAAPTQAAAAAAAAAVAAPAPPLAPEALPSLRAPASAAGSPGGAGPAARCQYVIKRLQGDTFASWLAVEGQLREDDTVLASGEDGPICISTAGVRLLALDSARPLVLRTASARRPALTLAADRVTVRHVEMHGATSCVGEPPVLLFKEGVKQCTVEDCTVAGNGKAKMKGACVWHRGRLLDGMALRVADAPRARAPVTVESGGYKMRRGNIGITLEDNVTSATIRRVSVSDVSATGVLLGCVRSLPRLSAWGTHARFAHAS
jgi:hypothetical protein